MALVRDPSAQQRRASVLRPRPCPFHKPRRKDKAQLYVLSTHRAGGFFWEVHCGDCGASGPVFREPEEAVAQWDRVSAKVHA